MQDSTDFHNDPSARAVSSLLEREVLSLLGQDPSSEENHNLQTRLKFVQIGLWEIRRRWHAGKFADMGLLLAHLDEDVEALKRELIGDTDEADCEPLACNH